jgi:hypothetical protein
MQDLCWRWQAASLLWFWCRALYPVLLTYCLTGPVSFQFHNIGLIYYKDISPIVRQAAVSHHQRAVLGYSHACNRRIKLCDMQPPSDSHGPRRRPSSDAASSPVGFRTTVIREIGANDVVMGRGAFAVRNEGNVRFGRILSELKAEYQVTNNRRTKDTIARQAVHQVYQNQGRFLRRLDDPDEMSSLGVGLDEAAFVLADDDSILLKAKQSLREKETLDASTVSGRDGEAARSSKKRRRHDESIGGKCAVGVGSAAPDAATAFPVLANSSADARVVRPTTATSLSPSEATLLAHRGPVIHHQHTPSHTLAMLWQQQQQLQQQQQFQQEQLALLQRQRLQQEQDQLTSWRMRAMGIPSMGDHSLAQALARLEQRRDNAALAQASLHSSPLSELYSSATLERLAATQNERQLHDTAFALSECVRIPHVSSNDDHSVTTRSNPAEYAVARSANVSTAPIAAAGFNGATISECAITAQSARFEHSQ